MVAVVSDEQIAAGIYCDAKGGKARGRGRPAVTAESKDPITRRRADHPAGSDLANSGVAVLSDEEIAETPFFRPAVNSKETQYLLQQRQKLGGFLPQRRQKAQALVIIVVK